MPTTEIVSQFLARSAALDSTLTTVPVTDLALSNVDGNIKLMRRVSGSDSVTVIGQLSPRAMVNLSKFTGASPKLLSAQTDQILNGLSRTQLSSRKTMSILMNPEIPGVVASIWPEELGYTPYSALLKGLEDRIFSIRGDIFANDSLSVLFAGDTTQVAGEEWLLGPCATLCGTGVTKSNFCFSGHRIVCLNGLVDTLFMANTVDGVTNEVVSAIIREMVEQSGQQREELEKVIKWSKDTLLQRERDLEVLVKTPAPVKEKLNAILDNPSVSVVEITEAGIEGRPTSVFHTYCLLTHLAKELPVLKSRFSVEGAAFSWMCRMKKMFGGN